MDISGWLLSIFGDNEWGMLLCVFLVFLIDAFIFPTLPEVFFAAGYISNPNILYGLELLSVAVIAEIIGIMTLYLIVSRIKIPARIERIATKYTDFLILGDERLLLLNRVAPMIPFAGAFIAIMKWDIKISMAYVIVGCVIKYGLILLMSEVFHNYFESGTAQIMTLVFVVAVIIVSFVASVIIKKRRGLST
jgi:hypothetical protein